jgi:glycosyltransferase involved in cell wall biosynthesis
MPPPVDTGDIAAEARQLGIRRVHVLAWRDLADVEAGGSELHAANVAKRWAEAGLDITMRTSYAQGHAPVVQRDGYRVVRRAGRYLVFPRAVLSELAERHGPWDAIVEIWNGVPFFSPLWTWLRGGKPHVVFLHHLHAEMWRMVLPENPRLARAGELIEARIAPLAYRRTRVVTLSESSKRELVREMRLPAGNVDVVPPGIDGRFTPGEHERRSETPLVVAVGRLVPVKRYDLLLRALARVKRDHPGLEAVIVGEGYEQPAIEALRAELGAEEWVHLRGRLSEDELVDLYRRAWVLTSASAREGWGMTITEAAACGTPSVVTRIAGHEDAVVDGETGLLVDGDEDGIARGIDALLSDDVLRKQLADGALTYAERFTWDATAAGALASLVAAAAGGDPPRLGRAPGSRRRENAPTT